MGTFQAQVLWTACEQGYHLTLSRKGTRQGDHTLRACQNPTHSGPQSPPSGTIHRLGGEYPGARYQSHNARRGNTHLQGDGRIQGPKYLTVSQNWAILSERTLPYLQTFPTESMEVGL